MKNLLQIGCLALCIFAFTNAASGQDRKLEKLDRYYDQGAHRKLLKYSDNLILNKGYDEFPEPYLYKSLALAKIGSDERSAKRYPFAMRNSVWTYREYLDLAAAQNVPIETGELNSALRDAWKSESSKLMAEGKINQAKYFSNQVLLLFNDSTPVVSTDPIEAAPPVVSTSNVKIRSKMLREAENLIGTPYKYGGTTKKGFDCSGFTGYVSDKCGLQLPRTSTSQSTSGKQIELADAQKGDLVFFGKKKGKKYDITHVAMVVSEPGETLKVIHSTSSKGVIIKRCRKLHLLAI